MLINHFVGTARWWASTVTGEGEAVRLPFGEFPGAVVLGMAALDQFTHGRDLARAIGQHTDLDPAPLTVSSDGIRRIVSFGDPGLVSVFGFRPEIMAETGPSETTGLPR